MQRRVCVRADAVVASEIHFSRRFPYGRSACLFRGAHCLHDAVCIMNAAPCSCRCPGQEERQAVAVVDCAGGGTGTDGWQWLQLDKEAF